MSDEIQTQPPVEAVTAPQTAPVEHIPLVDPASAPAPERAPEPDPAAVHTPVVTHESFLTELMAVVRRDCRGISHSLEGLMAKAEKHLGL
ncbi:MAG TPA: hypothetical protein VIY48_06130 [Candidatus Paceibacterota bacterium]